ncbi:hypothetical protein QMZ92_32280 [Streptomyces sp. HNM0645]|uniref:hypothetical protein n=1 Tax=Streptomyces sp. HNM0645 TaxID=2782343 RepID=UPI0024B6FA68|nr:hypothetical protein [Streptomyces sp. HNM0645]MDI9888904.1 hypothetical protein [Streptomyces sp. HNM0645]
MHLPHADPRSPLHVVRAAVFALVGGVLGLTARPLAAREPSDRAADAAAVTALLAVGLVHDRCGREPLGRPWPSPRGPRAALIHHDPETP